MKRIAAIVTLAFGVLAFSGSASAEVFWKTYGKAPKVEPHRIHVSSGTGSGTFEVTNLRWRNWGGKAAKATGTAHVKTCRPDCASGNTSPRRAKVTLYWKNNECGQTRYRNVAIKIIDRPKNWKWGPYAYACNGAQIVRVFPHTKPKPILRSSVAKRLFRNAAAISGRPKYLRCSRINRVRMRCKATWKSTWRNPFGPSVTDIWKVRGQVWKDRHSITVKGRQNHTVFDSNGKHDYASGVWKRFW